MKLYGEFFIATWEDVLAHDAYRELVLCFPTAMLPGTSLERLRWLEFMLTGELSDAPGRAKIEIWNPQTPAHYALLHEVPASLTKTIASLSKDDQRLSGFFWASLQGWEQHGMGAYEIEGMFFGMARLARQAVETGRDLFVCLREMP